MSESTEYILRCLDTYREHNSQPRAKKRRLDHLSWEEKIQRKKLKNRVAAQTSRDRKKAKFDQMESALKELFDKNETLLEECQELRASNQKLAQENADLYRQLRQPCANCSQNRTVECDVQKGSAESYLPPQGLKTHSAAALSKQTAQAFWKVALACLLYRTCSTSSTLRPTSTPIRLKSLRRVCCETSPEIWRQVLRKQIIKNEKIVDKLLLSKWWGRHQNNWNPVEAKG